MKFKATLGLSLVTVFSVSAFAQEVVYDRAAARAAYFRSLQENTNPAVTQQITTITTNPTYLPNGAQDSGGMQRTINDLLVSNDPQREANYIRMRAATLAPYIGRPGRAMSPSEIPNFDSAGYYEIPGFGRVQIPLTQRQMELFNEARRTGYAPTNTADFLIMLGIIR